MIRQYVPKSFRCCVAMTSGDSGDLTNWRQNSTEWN